MLALECMGIAHQHGTLYTTDGSALYHYTLDGRLVREMFADTTGYNTGSNYSWHYSYVQNFKEPCIYCN
ncbi:hypothetical protein DPMN_149536 [Dreissena polymorpha]|uniref:Uncharacterized protein n=1 Tax=Dreissena polymorpha TaxID=45954 RepID=A0A9D4FEK9_DREPO|nr:hypothetical protein DPMN_149536 [Dreissena polymorpha]